MQFHVNVGAGLGKTTLLVLDSAVNLVNLIKYNMTDPSYSDLNYMLSVYQPHVDNGWEQASQIVAQEAFKLIEYTNLQNVVLTISEIILVILAEWILFWRLISYCNRLNTSVCNLIVQ